MSTKIENYASELLEAEKTCIGVPPLTERDSSLTVEDAYYIQLEMVKRKLAEGRTIIGKKVGLTSAAMQKMLNVDEPDYGHLYDDMELKNQAVVEVDSMVAPKVEAEIGFVLSEDLVGPNVTYLDVMMATKYVVQRLKSSTAVSQIGKLN